MKKAIFLVEDIKDGKIYTLLEAAYSKVNEKLKEENNGRLNWLSEISILLNNHPSDFIKFEKASDFIKRDKLPEDRDVFYFISCYHQLDFFHVTNFLLMDPNVSDFLVKHKIPIIIDSSMEVVNHYDASLNLLENFMFSNINNHCSQATNHYRNLCSLEFYIVGSMYSRASTTSQNRNVKTYHSIFPGPFFQYNGRGLAFNMDVSVNRDARINKVNSRQIKDNTLVWQAFSNKTRLNRGLFILKAEHEGLGSVGRYSRLLPGKNEFIQEYNHCSMDRENKRLNFITPESLDSLNNVKYIDAKISGSSSTFDNSNFLLQVSLETFSAGSYQDILHSSSFLTEKTAMAIGSACPFIPMGGHKIGDQLRQAGFKEYSKLEFPNQPHLLDELDYVIDRLKEINSLSLIEKQKLYDSWKDNIVYNYDRYLNINIKKYYLEILNKSRRQATEVT